MVKNLKFGQKSKIWPINKNFIKKRNFVQKSIIGSKIKILLEKSCKILFKNQYKIIYETVRDYLTGKFNEPDEVSTGKRFSSNEYINEDPVDQQKRNVS